MRVGILLMVILCWTSPTTAAQDTGPTAPERNPEEIRFRNADLALGGLWFVPEGEGPFPAAVFIRGSGPSVRDNHWTRLLVNVLQERGIAVLLPDKRGSGASEGDWRTADFKDLAEDALAGVAYARSRPEVDPNWVGLVGLSQGGKIAPLAASRSRDVAFVINIVGSATDFTEQVSWEMYHTFREAGVSGAALQDALALQVLAEGYVKGTVEWTTFDAARQRALGGPAADVVRGFPATPDAAEWDFFRRVIDYDPIPHWKEVTQPILVIYGENDSNAPTVRSAYRLLRAWRETGHPDAMLLIVPGAGHALWEPHSDFHRPHLHPLVRETLGNWITSTTSPSRRGPPF